VEHRRVKRSRRELQGQLQARRASLQAELERRRRAVGAQKPERRRRWPWLLALLVLLLLAWLLRDCGCNEGPEVAEAPQVAGEPGEAAPVEPPPAPLTGTMDRLDRPELSAPPPAPVPWLASFRLQVAARSPRLAACFVGAAQPGTLKWTTSVEPSSGRVSDHSLEPMLGSVSLTAEQRDCVLGVLSDPAYRLEVSAGAPSTPSRVGMVIEF
jgi:hypothetical protein